MEKLQNIPPGEILQEEFLIPMGISQYRLSKELGIPETRISGIIRGTRRITADTALRLGLFFGNSAKFWLGLQNDFDIECERISKSLIYFQITRASHTRKDSHSRKQTMILKTNTSPAQTPSTPASVQF